MEPFDKFITKGRRRGRRRSFGAVLNCHIERVLGQSLNLSLQAKGTFNYIPVTSDMRGAGEKKLLLLRVTLIPLRSIWKEGEGAYSFKLDLLAGLET